ncbi:MvdC/MvdD family ATP grasp protein [Desulfosediminicola sp.]|uniref:MvdC/MvdD family ATP grasp protein n=1 Tax=Desulfosediminicola sp. TaxID=2886825 RepID=UPI003AF2AD45
MPSRVLVITSSFDLTTDYLLIKFNEIDFFRFNVDLFHDYEVTIDEKNVIIESPNRSCELNNIDAIYYRKPSLPNFSGILDDVYHSFAQKEIFSVIESVIESYSGRCISKPSLLRIANNKVVQCLMAKK